jgi:adenylate kinase
MRYIVTGTPGTGKTTFAKKYAKEHTLKYLDGKKIIAEHKLIESFDEARDCDVVDEEEFAKVCEKLLDEESFAILDSHLSHYISPKVVDVCFVTECALPELKRRLDARDYSEEKIRENLDAEIFRVCKTDAEEIGHTITLIDTNSF